MANKVAVFQDIVAELSALTNTSEALCSTFLKSFFALISERMADGVKVDKIGKFGIAGDKVVYVADKELAEFVNAAFDCFEPVALDEDFSDSETERALPMQPDSDFKQQEESSQTDSCCEQFEVNDVGEPQVDDAAQGDAVQEQEPEESEIEVEKEEELAENMDTEIVERTQRSRWKGCPFLGGFATGVAAIAIVASIFYYLGMLRFEQRKDLPEAAGKATNEVVANATPVVQNDSTSMMEQVQKEKEANAIQQEPQTFKVTETAYLSNISRKYYGHYAFWVYIYLENKDVIKDPDNLPVGIVLKIPAPEKYGIDKSNSESIKKAEIEALKIQQSFR